ncbi:MAG: site-2 protease family protein [Patescibacteria group bacterium]
MIDFLFTNPVTFVIWAVSLLIAVTIHEFSHAFVADKLGDPTPRVLGRVTLNPLAHLDPLGTIALLIAHIGWGKPVPFDPYNLQNPKRDSLFIALAGPASNFILAGILALFVRFLPGISFFIIPLLIINIGLGVFNLMPVPPLDGSKILAGILPKMQALEWEQFSTRYSMILLLIFVFPFSGRSLASMIVSPIINTILNFLL